MSILICFQNTTLYLLESNCRNNFPAQDFQLKHIEGLEMKATHSIRKVLVRQFGYDIKEHLF